MNFKNKALFFLLIASSVNLVHSMKYAKVIKCPDYGPYKDLKGKIVKIVGTSKEVWNIHDVWSSDAQRIPVIIMYSLSQPPKNGIVYYGKVNFRGFCFHESWLEEITEDEAKGSEKKKFIYFFKK